MRQQGRHRGTKSQRDTGAAGRNQNKSVVGHELARRGGAGALTTAVLPYVTAGVALMGANAMVLESAQPVADEPSELGEGLKTLDEEDTWKKKNIYD